MEELYNFWFKILENFFIYKAKAYLYRLVKTQTRKVS